MAHRGIQGHLHHCLNVHNLRESTLDAHTPVHRFMTNSVRGLGEVEDVAGARIVPGAACPGLLRLTRRPDPGVVAATTAARLSSAQAVQLLRAPDSGVVGGEPF